MATETDQLVLSISADTTQIRNAIKKLASENKQVTAAIRDQWGSVGANDNFSRLSKNFDQSSKAIQNNARVLQYQINDVVTSLGSGASAMQVFAQQAGQIQQTLAGGNGLQVLKAGLAGLVNPVNLTIAAFGLATFAASKYFETAEDASVETRKELEKQVGAIDAIVKKWGEAAPETKRVADQMKRAIEAIDQGQGSAAAKNFVAEELKKSFSEIAPLLRTALRNIRDLGDQRLDASVSKQLAELSDKLKSGTANAADLTRAIDLLKNASSLAGAAWADNLVAKLEKTVPLFSELTDQAQKLGAELKKLSEVQPLQPYGALSPLSSGQVAQGFDQNAAADIKAATADVSQATMEFIQARENFTAVARRDNDGRYRVGWWSDTVRDELGNVAKVTESTTTTIVAANRDLAARIAEAQESIQRAIGLDKWSSFSQEQKTALDSIVYNYGQLPDRVAKVIKAGGSNGQIAQAIADLGGDNQGINRKRRNMEAELFGGGDFSASAKTASMSFKELLDDAQRSTAVLTATGDAMESVAGSTDDFGYAVARARKEQELLNKAQEENIPLTDQMRAQISAAADAYGRAEQAINRQKDAAKDTARATKQNAQEWQQLGQQLAGIGSSAVSGLVQDLRNGVSAGEAFRNMLSKIVDDLLQLALNSALQGLFKSLFTGIGGAAGAGGFNLGAGMVPVSHTGGTAGMGTVRRSISAAAFLGAPRMHGGGIAGLRPGEIPTILQRGEIVLPRGVRGSSSGSMNVGDVNIDMSAAGYVTANTADAKAWGENVRKAVQIEMVRQSRPGGILRKLPTP